MFIAALFVMAETWKQTISINRGINEDMCIYTCIYTHTDTQHGLLAIKKNEIKPSAATRMDYHMK